MSNAFDVIRFVRWCALYGIPAVCRVMAGGMWAPFKELVKVINAAILKKEPNAYYSLEAELKKHKPDFISLLKNPVSMSLMSSLTPFHSLPPPFPPLLPSH